VTAAVGALADARLILPAQPRSLRLARLAASSLAADLDWSVDDIDDLRIAVDELCAAVIASAPDQATLEVSFHREGHSLVIQGTCEGGEAVVALDPFAREMLELTIQDFEVEGSGSVRRFRLRKEPMPQGDE
jgi:hypothetical protein